ncbi:hypothetical protein HZH68_016973 [Vespula germanica]|uniref:Uncharacterized protein n=1 Tax=Vespula germanica TaxID=30212 RepID=A0A834MQF8_VESGE|nr:hypothetical protein HZH68_016973 [Vespula germanica]
MEEKESLLLDISETSGPSDVKTNTSERGRKEKKEERPPYFTPYLVPPHPSTFPLHVSENFRRDNDRRAEICTTPICRSKLLLRGTCAVEGSTRKEQEQQQQQQQQQHRLGRSYNDRKS